MRAHIRHSICHNLKGMLLLYNLISLLALVLYLPILIMKGLNRGGIRFIKERLGVGDYQKADIWIHAVSVGETMACIPLLKRLKREYPQKRIIISTITHTGQRLAMERFHEAEGVIYMPWDTSICVKRVISSLMPELFITMETEIWPILFHYLKGGQSRIVIVNGRLSSDSFRGYNRIKRFMKGVLSNVDHFCMQSEIDAERIISLGADKGRVMVMGNIKFDIEMEAKEPPEWSKDLNDKIILAGSTHKGEDEVILNAYKSIKGEFHDVSLILAPRHPERFDEVEVMLRQMGFDYVRRTAMNSRDPSMGRRYDVILLDTIGELSNAFSIATMAFIGGSLLPYGGHNILEPAYWGKPIVFGPYMDNFPFAEDFLNESAAIVVRTTEEMADSMRGILKDPERAREMGGRARAIIDRNKGATDNAMQLIREIIDAS
ncbi:MAG: 3-deoxy-D-manno-octulosonic acid transferase [Thermodesulfovibrionia bacterium]